MTTDPVGSVWAYAIDLARALQEHGVEIALASMGAPLTGGQRKELKPLSHVTLFQSRFKLEWMDDPWADLDRAGDWLLEIEEAFAPDIIHLNGYAHGTLSWRAPKIVVGHSCVLSWWKDVKGRNSPAQWDRYQGSVARGLAAANLVVAPSRAMLHSLICHYGPLPAARVIPNGRHADFFRPGHKEPLVLTAGRLWDEAKNISALARVAPDLPWPIYIAGEETHPGGCVAEFDNLRRLGRLSPPALARWMSKASIYALPARYEPFGLSVLEAALSGCALVLGDIPSLRENWRGAALFVQPDDTEHLRRTLLQLVQSPALVKERASHAQCRAIQFTPQQMAARYLAAYAQAARQPATRNDEPCAAQISSVL
jgi:glycogen(starch) synthase